MHWIRSILAALVLVGLPLVVSAADHGVAEAVIDGTNVVAAVDAHGHAEAHAEHHGLPAAAPLLYDGGFFKLSNSMLAMIIVTVGLIVVAQVSMRNPKMVPTGLQNFVEWVVESLEAFLSGILGKGLAHQSFWFFATVFLFILFANWFGLFPGVGSVGFGSHATGNFIFPTFSHVDKPLLRGANADLNMTSAMSVIFFGCWIIWALKANGPGGFIKHIFGYSGDATGVMKAFLILVFVGVGLLETVSILFRPVSLSFRLFGNIFAGENLLEAMLLTGGPYFGWLIGLPFLVLELIVGFVQALVFVLLTAVFTSLICSHGDDHAHDEAHEHH